MSTFVMGGLVFQIEVSKQYSQDAFRADIMKVLRMAGVEGRRMSFILTDQHIVNDTFLEDVSNLLSTGEVPNLYAKKEDLDDVLNDLRPKATKKNVPDTPEDLYAYFLKRTQSRLHIILGFSPVGNLLRQRCRKFPSLISSSTLIFFPKWQPEAMKSVSMKLIRATNITNRIADDIAVAFVEVVGDVEASAESFYNTLRRKVYLTPKNFIDMINLFMSLLEQTKTEIGRRRRILSEGLDKLDSTKREVEVLRENLKQLQPQLELESQKTEQFLFQLERDKKEANVKEKLMEEEAFIVNKQAAEIKVLADEAQTELNSALPVLLEAEEALLQLNKNDIAEIRTFLSPPPAVQLVMEAVCTLLGVKGDWNSAKGLLMDMDFLSRLTNYNKTNIPEPILRRLRQIVSREEFDPVLVVRFFFFFCLFTYR
jgi:dynein heavy chain, axonemal